MNIKRNVFSYLQFKDKKRGSIVPSILRRHDCMHAIRRMYLNVNYKMRWCGVEDSPLSELLDFLQKRNVSLRILLKGNFGYFHVDFSFYSIEVATYFPIRSTCHATW